ncbi:MAG: acyl-CoA thioesterase [Geodermatophilaceae bacterium]|nr:acyl-CoA thioesterase [Geodermatophilaceae bacterium]MDQ3457647.1 acyl-CoA thioesterase [Actinomycetota bacterium]
MAFRYDVAVRWSDEDRLGHVNNSRYLTFTEDARLVWLSESPTGAGGVILARSEIDFRFPVHFVTGGRLVVETSVCSIGRSSLLIRQDIVWPEDAAGAGDAVARTRHVLVCYDYVRGAPRPWTDVEREWLSRWQDEEAA